MIPNSTQDEKRISPRITQCLPISLAVDEYDFETATENISSSGAYCNINKYVPPFTKVAIKMDLPITATKKQNSTVECKGVVVRSKYNNGHFDIAIFFSEIEETQQKKISRYIRRFLPQ